MNAIANIRARIIAVSETPRTISPESGSPRSRTWVSHVPGDVVTCTGSVCIDRTISVTPPLSAGSSPSAARSISVW